MQNITLFLDRDGVINKKMPDGDYVKNISEFEFLPGALKALNMLSKKYKRIIVISNQQGIYKGLLSESALQKIHLHMKRIVFENGGRIDGIYYCPHKKIPVSVGNQRRGWHFRRSQNFQILFLRNL